MRFPRHARIFKGQLDAAPFAGVFFLVLIFLTFNSQLVFTPGVRIDLPQGDALPGTAHPTARVYVDPSGQFYFENQIITATNLQRHLQVAVGNAKAHGEQLSLLVFADKLTPNEHLVRLGELARTAGIRELVQAIRPNPALPRGPESPP
ncbi:MAG: biopolymer transporter ExbD [Proteobacteria bacterium]|nr:biopolymer transporter ExbD [Pseudomonadota bacterium]